MPKQPSWEEIVERMNELRPDGVVHRETKSFCGTGPEVFTQAHEHLAARGGTKMVINIGLIYDRPENEVELHRRAMQSFKDDYDPNATPPTCPTIRVGPQNAADRFPVAD